MSGTVPLGGALLGAHSDAHVRMRNYARNKAVIIYISSNGVHVYMRVNVCVCVFVCVCVCVPCLGTEAMQHSLGCDLFHRLVVQDCVCAANFACVTLGVCGSTQHKEPLPPGFQCTTPAQP